jgi:hypothetical protein
LPKPRLIAGAALAESFSPPRGRVPLIKDVDASTRREAEQASEHRA